MIALYYISSHSHGENCRHVFAFSQIILFCLCFLCLNACGSCLREYLNCVCGRVHIEERWKEHQSTTNITLTRSRPLCVLTSVWRLPVAKSIVKKCVWNERQGWNSSGSMWRSFMQQDESCGFRGKKICCGWKESSACQQIYPDLLIDWVVDLLGSMNIHREMHKPSL